MPRRKTIIFLENLDINEEEAKPIQRLKLQMQKGFNPNKSGDVDKLLTLVSYLYAVNEHNLVRDLIEQVEAYARYDDERVYLWHEYGLLLLFMAELSPSDVDRNRYIQPVIENDINSDNRTRYQYYLEYIGGEYQDDAVVASFESQKYQCEYMSGHIIHLMYYKHMLSDEEDYQSELLVEINQLLLKSVTFLKLFLVKKTPYEPMHFFEGLSSRVRGAGLDAIGRYQHVLNFKE